MKVLRVIFGFIICILITIVLYFKLIIPIIGEAISIVLFVLIIDNNNMRVNVIFSILLTAIAVILVNYPNLYLREIDDNNFYGMILSQSILMGLVAYISKNYLLKIKKLPEEQSNS